MKEITPLCPSCGEKIKSGVFGSNSIFSEEQCLFISEMESLSLKAACNKCGDSLFESAKAKFQSLKKKTQAEMKSLVTHIPVVTIQCPIKWDYTVLGIVSGQSTSGTGLFSEFKSGWTDLFGAQSSTYNRKIAAGEFYCAEQIIAKTIEMGGNAVIAVDIDYSELGAEKGMIMVCMSGTAIRLNNIDILGEERRESLTKISELIGIIRSWKTKFPQVMSYFENVNN